MHLGLRQLLIFIIVAASTVAFSQEDSEFGEITEISDDANEPAIKEPGAEVPVKPPSSSTEVAPEPATEVEPTSKNDSPSGYPYAQIVEDNFKTNNPLISYRERRGTWGAMVSVAYSNYSPADYDPDFTSSEDYEQFYGNVDSPMIEATVSAKVNLSIFSVSFDVGGGHFQNSGRFGSSLSVSPIRMGGTIAIDGMFEEPVLVPYFSAGMYAVIYSEKLASQKVEGRTSAALYYAGGLRLQLDWLDPIASDESLVNFGLENTFMYVEGRYFAAAGDRVPDLSSPEESPYMFNVGLSLEF